MSGHTPTASRAPAVIEHQPPAQVQLGTLQAASPQALVVGASETAKILAGVIDTQRLAVAIQGRKYVRVEGWTTLAAMLGIVAREVETAEREGIYTATVELVRMTDGAVVSRASAECGDEPPWNKRPRYARRSMAQTRATGKAARLAFSWIMALAGYEATPYEEMEPLEAARPQSREPPPPSLAKPQTITDKQAKFLFAKAREAGVDNDTLKRELGREFGIASTRDLTPHDLERVLAMLPTWGRPADPQPAPAEDEDLDIARKQWGWNGDPWTLPGVIEEIERVASQTHQGAQRADDSTRLREEMARARRLEALAGRLRTKAGGQHDA